MQHLRALALQYPETVEGVVCSRSSFKAGNKAFLFMGEKEHSFDVMLKLRDSLAEAVKLSEKKPNQFSVGSHGWVTATFQESELPPPGLIERWIDESFRLLAPKRLVAQYPASGASVREATQSALGPKKSRTTKKGTKEKRK